jgi:large subunit ribosomal protein L3
MMRGLIGRKLGMTRVFGEDGHVQPVTVIEAGPCPVVQLREHSGKAVAAQLGFETKRPTRTSKGESGHAKAAGLEGAPRVLRDFPVPEDVQEPPKRGDMVTVGIFELGDVVKVTGTTRGRGFQGVVKRHGFAGGPATHGSTRYRKPGSLGPGTDPSRVIKGKKLPGQMGNTRHTTLGLRVVRIDPERNLLYVRGSVAGPANAVVLVTKQGGRSRYA